MPHVTELNYRVAGRPLLQRASLAVDKGERVALKCLIEDCQHRFHPHRQLAV